MALPDRKHFLFVVFVAFCKLSSGVRVDCYSPVQGIWYTVSGMNPPGKLPISSARDAMVAPSVSDHVMLMRIGAGAYGEVWLARNTLGTLRAVKIVRRAAFDDERPYEREFAGIQKFEPLSRSHDGFVDLLQVGRNDAEGWFYYVMELADPAESEKEKGREGAGENIDDNAFTPPPFPFSPLLLFSPAHYTPRTLASAVKLHGALPLDECLRIALALTNALAELHRHGLVHRDIKPSNIIFVGGVPKLADVGLVAAAKVVGQDRSFVGTEGYIPPEGPGTPQADLYSLGIVLYVMSTGKSHRDFPEPPADLATRPDPERERWLEFSAIIHRACQTDPRRRYASAEELLADIERLDAGRSVRRHQAWQRRSRFAFALAGAAAVITTAWFGFSRFNSSTVQPSAPSAASVETFENSGASDAEAFHRYLQAKEAMRLQSTNGYVPAITQLEGAVALDPGFAHAWLQLAKARYALDGFCFLPPKVCKPQAREAALKALSLDGGLVEAIVLLGRYKMEYEWDWEGAGREFRRAVELDPKHLEARSWLATWLSQVGRHDEAVRELEKARQAERGIAWLDRKLGVLLTHAGRQMEAEKWLREAVRRDPNDGAALFDLSNLLWAISGSHYGGSEGSRWC
ncbi:MAG: hypothetical protein EXS31_10825 [Pedosphaera sp.]|nr:hypothetical protein [Pedosphaera sp.]